MQIREETSADQAMIRELTALAFKGRPYAGGDEQDVIDRLRACGAMMLSLVAVAGSGLIGQVTFSPAVVEDGSGPWFALGPVSVLPSLQGEGVGGALIKEGLRRIDGLGALGCILTGDPNYYERFGFRVTESNAPDNEPAEYFQLLCLRGSPPVGKFTFHQAFYGDVG